MRERDGSNIRFGAIVIGAIAASTLLAVASETAPASAQQSGGPVCGSSFDPYSYTPAQVQACGYPVYPAQGTTPLAATSGSSGESGSVVKYQMANGVTAEQLIPPAGFRPETASAAELDEYGFPPRPSGGAALARWQKEMSGWRGSAPAAPFLTVSPAHTQAFSDSENSPNWAGYVIQSTSQKFDHAEGWYDEPVSYSSRCSTKDESTWAGLGGWVKGDVPLAQNGTAIGVPGISSHQAWWEFWPYNSMVPIDFSATAGGEFDASVRWLFPSGGQEDEYRFWFYNYATGQTDAFDTYVSEVTQGAIYGAASYSAEVVIERPSVNNQLTNLLNFGTLDVIASQANGAGFNSYSPSWSNGVERHGAHMYNPSTGDTLATPSDIYGGGEFTVTQNNCN